MITSLTAFRHVALAGYGRALQLSSPHLRHLASWPFPSSTSHQLVSPERIDQQRTKDPSARLFRRQNSTIGGPDTHIDYDLLPPEARAIARKYEREFNELFVSSWRRAQSEELDRRAQSEELDHGTSFPNLDETKRAWKRDFIGVAAVCFSQVVEDEERKFNGERHYAKFMPIVQSSGAGKSRLIDEYSRSSVGITFTCRYGSQSGYPPGDVEVTTLLRASGAVETSDSHATVIALLAAATKHGM